jgi:SPX domain protein involved in polyphosphate accumulation
MVTRVKTDLRHELKYLIRLDQQESLMAELGEYLTIDAHAGQDGLYPITSLYFDTPEHKFYWDKIEGHRVRRKVRVRIYGNAAMTPETPCFLEIKQRVDKLIRKRRVRLPYQEAVDFQAFDNPPADLPALERQLMQEVHYLYRALDIQPTCIVRYNRLAMEGNELYPDLRVTFDTNLRSRTHDLTLLSTDHADNSFFLRPDYAILEVKINNNVPYWLTQMLNRYRCRLQRVSKYCAALEHHHVVGPRRRVVVAPGHALAQ